MQAEECPASDYCIWDAPRQKIEADFYLRNGTRERVVLIPFGNTVLRRVTFPMRHIQ